jgi:hypothetical protein
MKIELKITMEELIELRIALNNSERRIKELSYMNWISNQ